MPLKDLDARRVYLRRYNQRPAQKVRRADWDRERWQRPAIKKQHATRMRIKSREARERILIRDDFFCLYCEQQFASKDLHIDHKVPVSRGGLDGDENRVTACGTCNRRKGTKSYEEFMAILHPDREPAWVTDEEERPWPRKRKRQSGK